MPVQDSSQAGLGDQPIEETVDVAEQTPGEGSAEEQQQPEQTFTRADVEKMLADYEKRVESRIQSQVAKSENRTNERIQQRLASLEENREALNLTDEAAYEAAQDAIIRDEQKKAFKQPKSPAGNGDQQVASQADPIQEFMATVDGIYQREGMRVEENDPEYKKFIDPVWNDPNGDPLDTLLAIKQAVREKKERLAAFKGNAKVRVTGGGGQQASNSKKPLTSSEKISRGLKENFNGKKPIEKGR